MGHRGSRGRCRGDKGHGSTGRQWEVRDTRDGGIRDGGTWGQRVRRCHHGGDAGVPAGTSTPPAMAATPVPAIAAPLSVNGYSPVPAQPAGPPAPEAVYASGVPPFPGACRPLPAPPLPPAPPNGPLCPQPRAPPPPGTPCSKPTPACSTTQVWPWGTGGTRGRGGGHCMALVGTGRAAGRHWGGIAWYWGHWESTGWGIAWHWEALEGH